MDKLEDIRIASPCRANWDNMEGDDRKRYCALCRKHVYNITEMSRSEAEALVDGSTRVCLRLYRRSDGTVITNDCPVGKRKVVIQFARTYALAAVFAVALLKILAFIPLRPIQDLAARGVNAAQAAANRWSQPPPPKTISSPLMGSN